MVERGAVTSRARVRAPFEARGESLERLREVAMTWWEWERASRARAWPKPEPAAVMNQTGVGMVGGGGDMVWCQDGSCARGGVYR